MFRCFLFFYRIRRYSRFIFFFFLMIRRPPRSTLDRSSAASDVYKRQTLWFGVFCADAHVCAHRAQIRPWLWSLHDPSKSSVQLDQAGRDTGFIAVSYTHLRAHETVLDLVCRLLLEKKKKTKSFHHIHS